MNNENKKNNKKVLKRVMVAMGATALLTGGIVTSTALNSYKAPQIPEANYVPMQNIESNNVASTKLSNNEIATYATDYSADTVYGTLVDIVELENKFREKHPNKTIYFSTRSSEYSLFDDSGIQISVDDFYDQYLTHYISDKISFSNIHYFNIPGLTEDDFETDFLFDTFVIAGSENYNICFNYVNDYQTLVILLMNGDDYVIYSATYNFTTGIANVYADKYDVRAKLYDSFSSSGWFQGDDQIDNISNGFLTNLISDLKVGLTIKESDDDYPSISAGDIVVNVDNPLTLDQIKSCFKANDPTEGDLTNEIQFSKITYQLDSNGKIAVGEYSITASVSDSSGNSATVTKKIHVVDITSPIVAGTNFSTGNITKLTDAEILKHLTYSDNYYSKDDISITLSYDDYKNNYTKPGDYEVRVTAKDPSGNVGTTTLTITVTDTTKPVITATNKITGNSTCLSQADLLALFSATDDVTASPNITIVTDNYTENYRKPGSYTVIAKATDDAGNSSQATATITVTDTTAPTITAINATKNQSYTTKLTEAELKALFKVSDDVTATDKIVVTIVTDNYTAKYNTPGSYTVTAKATDEAGNTAQATVTIKVIDDIKPVIVLTKEIKTTTQLALTMADIAKYVKATDAIDGNITPQITDKDGYLTKTNKVGTYNFEVTATDKSGNVAKETFVIIVEDKDVPVITVSGYTITAAAGQVYKRSDIIKFLIQTGQLTEEEADTVSVESNYFDSENPEAGNYELTITRADGSIQQMSLLVTESNNDAATNEGFWGWIKNHLAIVLTALGAVVLAALGFVFLRKKRR